MAQFVKTITKAVNGNAKRDISSAVRNFLVCALKERSRWSGNGDHCGVSKYHSARKVVQPKRQKLAVESQYFLIR